MKIWYLLFVLSLASFMAGCGGADERKAAYLQKAKTSIENKDYDKARIELKNVLQIDPKHSEAYYLLGRLHERKKDYQKAFGSYNKASELDPDNIDYQAKLGMFYLLLARDVDKAKDKEQIILTKDPKHKTGLLLKANILLFQEKRSEAKELVSKLNAESPEHVETALQLATYYQSDKDYDKAIGVINKCLEFNPDEMVLMHSLASLLYVSGDMEMAEKKYKEILQLEPDNFKNHLKLASFYGQTDRIDTAISVLKRAADDDLSNINRQLVLITYIQKEKSIDDAIAEAKDRLLNAENKSELMLSLSKLYIANNDIENAKDILSKIISDYSEESSGVKARLYLVNIYLRDNSLDDAKKIIDEAIKISPNNPEANLVKAKISIIEKDNQQAIISLRTVIKENSDNFEAYILLSAVHNGAGEIEQAKEVIQQAYENNRSNPKILLALSKYHFKNNNADKAEKLLDELLAIDANNYDALSMKSKLLIDGEKYSDANLIANVLISEHPDKDNGYLVRSLYLRQIGKQSEALTTLDDGYVNTNSSRKILAALVKLQLSIKQFSNAEDLIKKELTKNKDDIGLLLLLSGVYIASDQSSSAIATLQKVINIDPVSNKAYALLSQIYLKNDQIDSAVAILKDGLDQIKNDTTLSIALAGIYENRKNYNAAIELYETIVDRKETNIVAVNNLAALLSEHKTDATSLARAKYLADKIKDSKHPTILDTVGWVYFKTGNYVEAIEILKTVVDLAPDSPVFNYHLGMAYHKANDNESAKSHLIRALERKENFTGRSEAENLLKTL